MFFTFVTSICCILPLFLYYFYLKWIKEDECLGITEPPTIPLIGNLHMVWSSIQAKTLHLKIVELLNQYGDIIRLRFGTKLFIFTKDLKIIEEIVKNPQFIKSADYEIYEEWFGDGLVNASGEKWHKMRKLLTPAFHFQILERFIPLFEYHGKIFIKKIQNLSDGTAIDIVPWYHSFALDVISETSMGVKLNAQNEPNSKFIVTNKELMDLFSLRFYYPLYSIDWIWKLTKHYRKVCEGISYVHTFVENIINQRREELIANNNEINELEKSALLDILLKATIDGKPLTNKIIRDEITTFITAGHETTGSVLGFITFMLVKYPEVQNRVYEEIKENCLDDSSKRITINDITSLTYLDCVIKETLRLYPTFPCNFKQCLEDVSFGKIFIPARTTIVTANLANHMCDKNFKNPGIFNPDRWNDEVSTKDRNPYAYQPFAAGVRSCIGKKFALLEIKTLLIKILREFQLEIGYEGFEMDIRNTTLTHSANGVQVKFKKRN
uniref:CSON009394 protein n=1 Tax=Culicoides sonorensis TaxID=179676 RepID=A0A336M072_CULSO